MMIDKTTRETLMILLEAAKDDQRRCMGGVDPDGCIAASKRITALREALRDSAALTAHFGHAIDHKEC